MFSNPKPLAISKIVVQSLANNIRTSNGNKIYHICNVEYGL